VEAQLAQYDAFRVPRNAELPDARGVFFIPHSDIRIASSLATRSRRGH
jgi:hypothetical protein